MAKDDGIRADEGGKGDGKQTATSVARRKHVHRNGSCDNETRSEVCRPETSHLADVMQDSRRGLGAG